MLVLKEKTGQESNTKFITVYLFPDSPPDVRYLHIKDGNFYGFQFFLK